MKNILVYKKDYVDFVCEFYKRMGINQNKLAEFIELSPAMLSSMKNYSVNISDKTIDKIQRITKIPFLKVIYNNSLKINKQINETI